MDFQKKVYEGQVSFEATLQAKLVSIGDTILQNSKGTEYVLCQVEMPNKDGQPIVRNAMIYSGNYTHPEANWVVGNSYLTTVTITEGRTDALVKVSHLQQAQRASVQDFGFDLAEADFAETVANEDFANENEEFLTTEQIAETVVG